MSERIEIDAVHRVRPGETVVVKLAPSTTPEEMAQFVSDLESKVSAGVKVLCIGGDIELDVILTSEADRIAEAVRKAMGHPGHTVSVDDPWKGFPLEGDEVQR